MIFSIAMSFVVLMFVASAIFLLTAPNGLSRRHGFGSVVATIELFAALFLVIPQTRIWGIVIAGIVTIARVVFLFAANRPLSTVPGLMVLGALVPVALAR